MPRTFRLSLLAIPHVLRGTVVKHWFLPTSLIWTRPGIRCPANNVGNTVIMADEHSVDDRAMPASGKATQTHDNDIGYRGRSTSRLKSERRRKAILEATLRIAARDGIRGIKHRPVAREANVPLASTTYYFRDIDELISDAFLFFAENAQQHVSHFYETVDHVLDGAPSPSLYPGGEGRLALARRLASIAAAYLNEQFIHRRDEVLAEQVFLLEALRDKRLAALAIKYRNAWINGLENVLARLQTPMPRRDAALLVSVVLGLGYDGMLYGDGFQRGKLEPTIERLVFLVMDVRDAEALAGPGSP